MKKIAKHKIDLTKLIGKYIPNVTRKPFQLTKDYFENMHKLKSWKFLADQLEFSHLGVGPSTMSLSPLLDTPYFLFLFFLFMFIYFGFWVWGMV